MSEENKIRPFFIGLVDGSLTNHLIKELEKNLEGYPVCKLSMTNYLKDGTKSDSSPEYIDFELLLSNLLKLLNNEECFIPIYDLKAKKRSSETKKVEPCQIIILEGLLCFYDDSIRNMMDLKIFIETSKDIRFIEAISKEIENNNNINLKEILEKFFKEMKPTYTNFIITKKYADIIIPNEKGNETAINLIMNYLKLLLDRVKRQESVFFFINEIIDSKYEFCKDNLILKKEKSAIDFLRALFEDLIKLRQDGEFVEIIRKNLLEMIESLLIDYLQKFTEIKLVFDSDDITNCDFKHCSTVLFFKTAILTSNDIEKPQYILSKNKDINIIICSIFLAPRFANLLLKKQVDTILFATLYFSEFFVKYEKIIKSDQLVFNEEELKKLVKQMLSNRLILG